MKKAKYIVIEGVEGVGKTTQTQKLVDLLRSQGYTVLQTKEPGSEHSPLTMTLRGIMLDNKYDAEMTRLAREFISQAIRSIHLEKVIVPNLYKYDFIIQDRGILSGYAYGTGCGNSYGTLKYLSEQVVDSASTGDAISPYPTKIYDSVVYLRGDSLKGLAKAKSAKQEFETGDAMESRGNDFITNVSKNMEDMSSRFHTVRIDVDNKNIEQVHSEILNALGLEK